MNVPASFLVPVLRSFWFLALAAAALGQSLLDDYSRDVLSVQARTVSSVALCAPSHGSMKSTDRMHAISGMQAHVHV
jgi:hypothetical protein